jgi:ribose-phosphate pyrophosphokinase
VRARDVYVLCSLYGDTTASANDKLVRLLLLLGTLKDAGATRVTAVVPYLAYARKDRRTKARDPVSTRYVAQLFEAVGCDRIVVLDVHNLAAYQNAFRIPAEHLEARPLLIEHTAARLARSQATAVTVLSPDIGGVKRALAFRATLAERLGVPVATAFIEKERSEGVLRGDTLVGPVASHQVVIVDDLIASGNTLLRAARACRANGALTVHAVATHGDFSADAPAVLADAAFDGVLVTDSIDPTRLRSAPANIDTVATAPLFAEAIRRLHEGGSLSALA